MEFLVVAPDGQEYGPASLETLKQWAQENRLSQDTNLRNFQTSQLVMAKDVPGLFPEVVNPPPQSRAPVPPTPTALPPSPYQRPPMPQMSRPVSNARGGYDTGTGDVWGAIIRAVLAVVLFYFLHGLGLIVAVYGLVAAIRAHSKGHQLGVVAIVVSVIALVAVIIGWVLRIGGAGGV